MTRTVETKKFGEVEVRNAMLDIDGTTLADGIEIKGDDFDLIEIQGWYDVEELSVKKIEEFIENNI